MRRMGIVIAVLAFGIGMVGAAAEEERRGDRVLDGVLSGLLGQPQQPADAMYSAKERERLASLLQSGEYVTSRQGEPVDLVVFGIPLTQTDHVYTAHPVRPSSTGTPPSSQR